MSDNVRTRHFIHELVDEDIRKGRWGTWSAADGAERAGRPRVHTRFPPEPNGYLHIGHAKSICLNYGLAAEYGGKFNLRFDDTNPVKEEQEYVDSIIADVRWLGAKWPGMAAGAAPPPPAVAVAQPPSAVHLSLAGVLFGSDYFPQMYAWAIELIRKGRAFVCDCTADEVRRLRGSLTRPGTECPHRRRDVAENLELAERMKRGEFPDGSRTIRARIDVTHANLNLRDPVLYRILHAEHHRTGNAWCVYPMYDWAHGFEDSIEGITHSICTLEFENHRPLYDWFIDAVNEGRTDDGSGPWGRKIHHPQQIEFARLNLTYTVMSKRKLLHLVKRGHVRGWDDPRMPTLSGLRRRGYTPEAIRAFCADVGVAKFDSVIDMVRLENALREDLNRRAPRVMGVLRPLKLVIENWPGEEGTEMRASGQGARTDHEGTQGSGHVDWLEAINNPEDPAAGTRKVPFSRELYIEREDFMETPPPKFWRLYPGNEVRLRYAYFVKCTGFTKDPTTGEVTEVRCTYDPATRGGDAPDGRKVKSTLHWVSAAHAVEAEVRLYTHLFTTPNPEDVSEAAAEADQIGDAGRLAVDASSAARPAAGGPGAASDEPWLANLNPNSLEIVRAMIEPSVADAASGAKFQFERHGYFCVDPDSEEPRSHEATKPRRLVFNRAVSLRDSWAKEKLR
ncbi:MAG: Glutamine--tRNA ligase [Phycisphaerae bacterium]|nr:Glutamine--tRNA ligase [Phycisphaerae bacterium]